MAGLLWWQGRPTTDEDGDTEATAPVWTVDAGRAARLVIERADGRVVLERRDGAWWLPERDEPADARRVESLLDQLAGLRRAIPVAAAGGEAFGLGARPAAVVTWTDDAGAEQRLEVGIRAPAAYRVYVRTADGGIGAASGDPTEALATPAAAFADRHVFRLRPEAVRSVRLELDGHALEVRGQDRTWHVAGFGRADPDRVDDLVTDLLDLQLDERRDGLADPLPDAVVTVGLADGSEQVLILGPPDGEGMDARTPDGRGGRVFAGARRMLGRGPTDVGQRTAFQLRPERADAVSFHGLGHTFVASRSDTGWSAPALDPAAVYDHLLALASLPVVPTLDPLPPAAAPEARLTFHEPPAVDGGASLAVTFEIGPVLPDGTRAVRDAAGPGPGVRVDAAALDTVVRALP